MLRRPLSTVSEMSATVRQINTQYNQMVESVKRTAGDTDTLAEDVRGTYESTLKCEDMKPCAAEPMCLLVN